MIDKVNILIAKLNDGAIIPTYAHYDDAGMDFYAAEPASFPAGHTQIVSTGIAIAIPEGYVGLVHPRSGLAADKQITVLNAPGTIDSGYRGEIKVILHNAGRQYVTINPGDRIAQLVIQRYEKAELLEVDELPDTLRGEMGFGSTGL